jgi:hypothetical protein
MGRELLFAAIESRPYLLHVVDDDALWTRVAGAACSAREYAQLRLALTGLDIALYDQAAGLDDPQRCRGELARVARLRERIQIRRDALFEVATGVRQPDEPLPEPVRPPRPGRGKGGRGKRSPVTAAQIVESAAGGVLQIDAAIELGISTATLGKILAREGVPSPWARKRTPV